MKSNIQNPYEQVDGYNCFGCSMKNDLGLQMQFIEEGEEIVSYWTPHQRFEGWMGVLHGGIQASLLDEIGSWLVFVKLKTAGVTAELNVQYKQAVRVTDNPITIRARLKEVKFQLAFIEAELIDHEGIICSKAKMKYFIFKEDIAKEKYLYPGIEEFYEKE
jgi:uncharacterized protein (TIGR00369 family)